MVSQALLPGGASLSGLRICRAELEFWMPLQPLQTMALDELLRRHLWAGEPRPALKPQTVEGLLMGFADLVLESAGRYQVLDYKSNRLGSSPSHYTPAALQAAVLEHRYDLQAALYLLALHRLLQQRLGPRYHLDTHLGAAHFVFLRGIDQAGGHLISVEPDAAWLLPLDELLGRPGASSHT
ncbi:MAG: hypothetical protein EBS47_09295 [Betaproteobacteria bacterium]|nr:hypothetical protein [Betaproteobacteria bacterium]